MACDKLAPRLAPIEPDETSRCKGFRVTFRKALQPSKADRQAPHKQPTSTPHKHGPGQYRAPPQPQGPAGGGLGGKG